MTGGSAKTPAAEVASTVELTKATEVPICEVYALYDADSDKEGDWGQTIWRPGSSSPRVRS